MRDESTMDIRRLYIPAGEFKYIAINDDNFYDFSEHALRINGRAFRYTCLLIGCPLCEARNQAGTFSALSVWDLDRDALMVWVMPRHVGMQLREEREKIGKSLRARKYRIRRPQEADQKRERVFRFDGYFDEMFAEPQINFEKMFAATSAAQLYSALKLANSFIDLAPESIGSLGSALRAWSAKNG